MNMKHLRFLSMMLMAFVAVFAFTACGDDDDDNAGQNSNNSEQQQGGGSEIDAAQLIGSWTAVAFTPEGKSKIVLDRKNEEHWQYCVRFVLTANEITEYAINYQGSEGYRGREEKTLIGKYRIEGNTFIIYDFYEGYHNVKNYEEKGRGEMSTQPVQATIKLTNSVFFITIAGYGTYELNKNETPAEASILGTWGTTRIVGSATNPTTYETVESWDNTPSINDAQTGKESLKYMEFTFGDNNYFKLQQFDEETREFTFIMEGTWQQNENILSVDFGHGMGKSVELVSLTKDQLVIHENYIDEEFTVKGSKDKMTVIYDETIYFSRK